VKINETILYLGQEYHLEYKDTDRFSMLPYDKCKQVYGVCFYGNKIVVGFSRKMKKWSLIGGTIEPGELFTQTLRREVQEESNMKALTLEFIGVQDVYEAGGICRQARFFCVAEPYGPFVSDPDGDIVEIKLIDPVDYKKYFDWKIVGEHLMNRVIEMLNSSQKK